MHVSSLLFPALLLPSAAGLEKAKNHRRANVLRLIQIRLTTASVGKICPACKDNSPQGTIGALLSLTAERVTLASSSQ